MLVSLRQWLYQRGLLQSQALPACVVSVGNLSMGGTGKSPFALHLAAWALKKKISVALLTRGYKRRRRALEIVTPHAPLPEVSRLGDEPWMIKHRLPGISLLVHRDRARLAGRHWEKLGAPQLVLLDDAFQHWQAQRDFDVVMLDANERLNQKNFPFGRLREKAGALERADLVVITRAESLPPAELASLVSEVRAYAASPAARPWKKERRGPLRVVAADYEFDHFFDFSSGQECAPPREASLVLAAGVAKPAGVRSLVHSLQLPVREELFFPDHHPLGPAERRALKASLAAHGDSALLVTEKDWARWRDELAGVKGYGLRIRLKFLGDGEKVLADFCGDLEKCFTSRSLP